MKRLDQWLSNLGYCSRREARDWIKAGRIANAAGEHYTDPSQKAEAEGIRVDGEALDHPEGLLVAMNKPLDVVCSQDTREGRRVYDLLPPRWNRRSPALTTIGRLDRDTTGLLLLTDQSPLVHRLTSPKQKLPKRYRARLAQSVPSPRQSEVTALFRSGTLELEGQACLPAELEWKSPELAEVVLLEGRFHQVRRMFAAAELTVLNLQRTSFGQLTLPADLAPGEYRLLPLDFFRF